MVVEKFEYYCDCCMKQVEKKEDLKDIKLMLEDEQCKPNRSRLPARPIIPRLCVERYNKSFCTTCYEDYRNAINNFVSTMAQFGIAEYKDEDDDDDLM